jgi:hypothetical protein
VGVPTAVVVSVGERTGVVRAQEPVVVQARADATRLLQPRSPYTPPPEDFPRGRELVSRSFRLDPPAGLRPNRPLMPPGLAELSALARWAGWWDPRWLALLAVTGLAALCGRLVGAGSPSFLALVLLAPPLAIGSVLGSLAALPLLALVAAWLLARAGHARAAGLVAGVAVALDHRSVLAAPLVVDSTPGDATGRARALAFAALAYVVLVLPVALLDPHSFTERLGVGKPGPGLGLFDLLAYRGADASALGMALAATTPFVAVAISWLLLERGSGPPLARAGIASLAGIVLAPAISAEAVAVPLALLGLAAADRPGADA